MGNISPSLWFDKNAEEAVNFYTSIFKDSKIGDIMRWRETGPGPEGSVLSITFELQGQEYIAINGGPNYKFNPAVSFMVKCKTQEEIDYYWGKLLEGGKEDQCGWLTDKFGLSWQITPEVLLQMHMDKDPEKAGRVMQAMLKMVKLDIKTLQDAYDGKA